jgi:hypothetical protein
VQGRYDSLLGSLDLFFNHNGRGDKLLSALVGRCDAPRFAMFDESRGE